MAFNIMLVCKTALFVAYLVFTQHLFVPSIISNPLFSLCLGCCYPFYTFLWFKPKPFCAFVEAVGGSAFNPSKAMHDFAMVFKAVQIYCLWIVVPASTKSDIFSMSIKTDSTFVLGMILFVAGQYLNYRVNTAIKLDGVYYGIRFGIDVPWVTDFPYNLWFVPDPQYVASVLTIWGLYLTLSFPICWAYFITADYLYLAVLEAAEWTPRASYVRPKEG